MSLTAATVSVIAWLSFVNTIVSLTAYPCPGFVITTEVVAVVVVVIVAIHPVPLPDVEVWANVCASAVKLDNPVIVSSVNENTEFGLSPTTPAIVILDLFWS